MKSPTFGKLLTQAIRIIAALEDKPIQVVQDEIGLSLDYKSGKNEVEYWRKGNVPTPDVVIRLAQICLQRGKLSHDWIREFLDKAGVPDRDHHLAELFTDPSLEKPTPTIDSDDPNKISNLFIASNQNPISSLLPQGLSKNFTWIAIPEGTFWMGSDPAIDPETKPNETPQHQVYLPQFFIAREPVTNYQYHLFLQDTGYPPPHYWPKGLMPPQKENHPVVGVNWFDALAFCQWAKVRLPTEAEWEKAARGEDGRKYPWGNNPPDRRLSNYDQIWGQTTPVDEFALRGASPYGVWDLAGNVWEWTSTLWGQAPAKPEYTYPYQAFDGREQLEANDRFFRLVRGGAFDRYPEYLRSAYRRCLSPLSKYAVVGFRVAKDSTT